MPLLGSPPGDAFGQSLPLTTTARRFSGNRHLGFLVLLAACLSEFLFQSNHGAINILNLSQKFFFAFGQFDELLQPRSRDLGRHAVFSGAPQRMQIPLTREVSKLPQAEGTTCKVALLTANQADVAGFENGCG